MDLHAVEAGFDGTVHRITKLSDHHLHFFRRQRLRGAGTFTRRGDSAGRDRGFPADQRGLNHAAAVVNLQNGFRTLGLDGVRDSGQVRDFVVAVDADSARERGTAVIDKGALDDHGADAAGTHAVILNEIAGHAAVVIAGTGGHRGHHQAVFQHRPFRQCQRIKNRGERIHDEQLHCWRW